MRTCSRCGNPGHDIRTCPTPAGHRLTLAIDLSGGYGQWQPHCGDCDWVGSWHTDRTEALAESSDHQRSTRW